MKIHVLSDLHLEFSNYQTPEAVDVADVIVLAGDLWKGDHGIHWARATWPDREVVYIAGNHEAYGKDRIDVMARLRIAAQETGVHFLENDQVVIEGVRFLGATLWTDFRLYGNSAQRDCMVIGQQGLADFRVIHEGSRHFSPNDALRLHEESVAWLRQRLDEPFDGPTVVVTHHAPAWKSVVPRFQDDRLSACFASRLEYLMGKSQLWIHGHMHDSLDYEIAGTRVICNPRGYTGPGRPVENASFDPGLIVEIEAGRVDVHRTVSLVSVLDKAALREALMAPQLLLEEPFNSHYYDLRGLPQPLAEEFHAAIGKTTRVGFGIHASDWEPWRDRKLKKLEVAEWLFRLPKQSCEHCDFYDLGSLPEIVRGQYFRDRPIDQRPIVDGAEFPVYAVDFELWRNQIIR